MISTQFSGPHRSKGFSLLEVMVALAILGVSVVAVFQLFSATLRISKKAENHTKAVIYAKSLMDGLFSVKDPTLETGPVTLENGFTGNREVTVKQTSEDEHAKLYEIVVTINWPPSGSFRIKALRTIYETQ